MTSNVRNRYGRPFDELDAVKLRLCVLGHLCGHRVSWSLESEDGVAMMGEVLHQGSEPQRFTAVDWRT